MHVMREQVTLLLLVPLELMVFLAKVEPCSAARAAVCSTKVLAGASLGKGPVKMIPGPISTMGLLGILSMSSQETPSATTWIACCRAGPASAEPGHMYPVRMNLYHTLGGGRFLACIINITYYDLRKLGAYCLVLT